MVLNRDIMTNSSDIRFRCSSAGYLMTEPKEKSPLQKWTESVASLEKMKNDYTETKNKETKTAKNKLESIEKLMSKTNQLEKIKDDIFLSDSCITHLVDVFVSAKYKRKEEHQGKQLDKGNGREEDAITLVSRLTKKYYKKNDVRLTNEYITGEIDIYQGDSIESATHTTDTKVSWSAHTFFRTQQDNLNKLYYWQGQGYMWLSGSKHHTVAYCLLNGTASAILDEKRKLSYQNGMLDISGNASVKYKELCKQIEINHIFDINSFKEENPFFEFDNDIQNWSYDIPMEERLFTIDFDRNNHDIERLKNRIVEAKKWMDINLFKATDYSAKISDYKKHTKKLNQIL